MLRRALPASFEPGLGRRCLFARTFDDPDAFTPDVQIFTDDAPKWIALHEGTDYCRQHVIKLDRRMEEPWRKVVVRPASPAGEQSQD